jgi:hypothetical protein
MLINWDTPQVINELYGKNANKNATVVTVEKGP